MGLFGSILKGIGKVAKAGLSVATHGVSDKVISAAKSFGVKLTAKRQKPKLNTEQETALINKMGQALPRVRITEVQDDMRSGGGLIGTYKRKPAYKSKRSGVSVRSAASNGTRAAAPRALPAPRKRAKRAASSGAKRAPPPGGLDLSAMAAAWRSAGKPGTWIGWIKSNQIRRPR